MPLIDARTIDEPLLVFSFWKMESEWKRRSKQTTKSTREVTEAKNCPFRFIEEKGN